MTTLTLTSTPPSVPASAMLASIVSSEELSPTEAITAGSARVQASIARSLPGRVWLGGQGLIRPLRAELAASGADEFTATEPTTGIFGVGCSAAVAIEDLRAALRDHQEVLEASAPLSTDLEGQLRFLRLHLGPL